MTKPIEKVQAQIKIFHNNTYRLIDFERIIDAVEYFEQFNPPKYQYICVLYIRYHDRLEKNAEKEVKLFLVNNIK